MTKIGSAQVSTLFFMYLRVNLVLLINYFRKNSSSFSSSSLTSLNVYQNDFIDNFLNLFPYFLSNLLRIKIAKGMEPNKMLK